MKSVWRSWLLGIVAVAATIASSIPAGAQTVTGTHNIAFGSLDRSATMSVPYVSPSAAQFTVTGRQGRTARITVTSTSLANAGATLPITIASGDCAYSTDNGVTWRVFTTGTLFQDVVIPNGVGNGSDGSVLVRVGGAVTANPMQGRGTYTGTVSTSAAYR